MKKNIYLLIVGILFSSTLAFAQEKNTPKRKVYLSSNFDSYLLTTSIMSNQRVDNKWTTPRFTLFLHLGGNVNYDFNRNFGIYTGLNIKNIGFIEKYNNPDSTAIRRSYTFGIPFGVKIGNLENNKTYLILGGGIDFPFLYKEKGFVERNNKTKTGPEWFSDRTAQVLPYFFVGARFNPGVYLKLQYYPTNFMNQNYETTIQTPTGWNAIKPYDGYNVNLVMLSLGFDINFTPKY